MHLSMFTFSAESFLSTLFRVLKTEGIEETLPEPENTRVAATPYPAMTSRSRGKPLPTGGSLERNVFPKQFFAKEFLLQYTTNAF